MKIRPRILVVDDLPAILRLLRRQLHPHADVDVAESAEDALALLEARSFYAILSDRTMGGGLDGVELLEIVRERWPDVRRVLMTGDLVTTDFPFSPWQARLRKPFEAREVLAALALVDVD